MNLNEKRSAARQAGLDIVAAAKALGRDINDEESAKIAELVEEVKSLDVQIEKAAKDEALVKSLGELGKSDEVVETKSAAPVAVVNEPAPQATSLGEHFVKSAAFEQVKSAQGQRFTVSAPEFHGLKATAANPFLTTNDGSAPGALTGLTQTQYGSVIASPLQRPTIASLMPNGQLSATSLTYYTQAAMTASASGFKSVAENGAKQELGFNFEAVTETLKKIAGWYAISDEAVTDTPYLRSVIDNQLLLRLALAEEQQLLTASGGGNDLVGLLHRSGVQPLDLTGSAASGVAKALNGIFHASTMIQTATFMQPDGLIISPNTYEALRLALDANNQYYAGGPFTGAYGNAGLSHSPQLWTWPTVITTAIPDNTVLVGNFQQGAAVWRKGGVRVDSTNTDGNDFTNNIIKVRAEERLLLQVSYPSAFVNVSLKLS
jgi:HK97 family phage major capsid protein